MPNTEDRPGADNTAERAVMAVLLDEPLLTRDELIGAVACRDQDTVDVEDAIDELLAAGLIHMIEDRFLFASRAARHAIGLGL